MKKRHLPGKHSQDTDVYAASAIHLFRKET